MLSDFGPQYDATVTARREAAGAVILGKLNMTEGAMVGYHRNFVVPRNPWDLIALPVFRQVGLEWQSRQGWATRPSALIRVVPFDCRHPPMALWDSSLHGAASAGMAFWRSLLRLTTSAQ